MMAEKNFHETTKSVQTVKTVYVLYKAKDHDIARHGFVIINKEKVRDALRKVIEEHAGKKCFQPSMLIRCLCS